MESVRMFGALIATALVSACSHTSELASSPNTGLVRRTCQQVMGYSPGEIHFDSCVESLQRTLARLKENQSLARDREACSDQGLRSGEPEFGRCVLRATQISSRTGTAS